jgi:hypothetical protein
LSSSHWHFCISKTQLHVEQKAAKNAKGKSVEDKKFATAARKAFLDLSPTRATANSGDLIPSGWLTATSVTSFSTNSIKDIFRMISPCSQQHYRNARSMLPTALIRLAPEFAAPSKLRSKWKTKTAKDSKTKAIEERKFVVAACKAKAVAKKKERLISSAKAKAAVGSRVDELRTKLVEATKYPSRAWHSPHCAYVPPFSFSPKKSA